MIDAGETGMGWHEYGAKRIGAKRVLDEMGVGQNRYGAKRIWGEITKVLGDWYKNIGWNE